MITLETITLFLGLGFSLLVYLLVGVPWLSLVTR
jgi:hypothetical protein